MEITADDMTPEVATESSLRRAFDSDEGFFDFVVLSRGDEEFLQAGHWWFMTQKTNTDFWQPAFDTATAGLPATEDEREPGLYAVEFRDTAGLFGVNQMLDRTQLLDLFLTYLHGGEGWRIGLSWEPLADES